MKSLEDNDLAFIDVPEKITFPIPLDGIFIKPERKLDNIVH